MLPEKCVGTCVLNLGDSKTGLTPIFIAVHDIDLEVVKLLITKGANINLREKIRNKSPLEFAYDTKNSDIIKILEDNNSKSVLEIVLVSNYRKK